MSAQWGGTSGIEAWSLGLLFLQCFDTVGWVFWPIKPIPDMTYNMFGGTLNLKSLVFVGQMPSKWRQRAETDFCVRESIADYQTEAWQNVVY